MLPYLEALGEPRLGAGNAARRVAAVWRELRAKLDGPPGTPPVRAFVNHYPRPKLPGRCVSVQAVFCDMFDLFIATEQPRAFEQYDRIEKGEEIPGRILELRQVWQLEGGPRLVAAMVEVTTRVRFPSGHRYLPPVSFPDEKAAELLFDTIAGSHFPIYGGGDRHGMAWSDKSCGTGAADPAQFEYVAPARAQLDDSLRTGDTAITTTPIDDDVAARLRAYVTRA